MEEEKNLLGGLLLELRRGMLVLSVLSQMGEPKYGYALVQSLEKQGVEDVYKRQELHIPARISQELSYQVRDIAVKAFKALDCSGLSRVDFFVTPAHEIFLNELNTMPGFTSISMYPKLWQATGMTYGALLDLSLIHI